ncbi:MAG: hypothetical protein ACRDV0_07030 [Acidimicrobiales bacterium]
MPPKLDHHHRMTVQKIFGHPLNHNIRWNEVRSLLARFGEVHETHRGNWAVTDGSGTHSFGSTRSRVLTDEQVIRLRGFLRTYGLGPGKLSAA